MKGEKDLFVAEEQNLSSSVVSQGTVVLDFWVHWVLLFQKHQEFLAIGKRSILLTGITQIEDRREMQWWVLISV